jgi:hypothetical protein
MTENEKTTFGVTIEPQPEHLPATPTKTPSLRDAPPSPLTSSSTPRRDAANSFDFYDHQDAQKTETDLKGPQSHAHDLEAQRDLGLVQTESSRFGCKKRDESMWPSLSSQKAKKKQAKREKRAKSWNPMAGMGKRQKLIVTLIIALFIIGAAVGIGVGVSKAVGGGVTKVGGGTKPIGSNGKDQA